MLVRYWPSQQAGEGPGALPDCEGENDFEAQMYITVFTANGRHVRDILRMLKKVLEQFDPSKEGKLRYSQRLFGCRLGSENGDIKYSIK